MQPELLAPKPASVATHAARDVSVMVLIPCYNEELTIRQVVREFRAKLPQATICVFDNNSSDRTADEAIEAGAMLLCERRQGKGYVVQSMFHQLDADIYIMVDGDGTYPADTVDALMAPILAGEADMVVGSRLHTESQSRFRLLNRFGNRLFLTILNRLFNVHLTDILSGYRAFNRKFVKDMPIFSQGFEIETELTIKALQRGHRVVEVPVDLRSRPEGSFSKIRLVHDGLLILNTILALFRDYKPLTFFALLGSLLIIAGIIPGVVVIVEYLKTGLVLRFPSALLAVGCISMGMLLLVSGLIIHTITRRFQELDYKLQLLNEELLDQINKPLWRQRVARIKSSERAEVRSHG